MDSSFTLRLQQLRRELEASYSSDSFGLSVLYAIRRELLRSCHGISYEQLTRWPEALQYRFRQVRSALQAPPAFPTPSVEAQYEQTRQALTVLEEVTQRIVLPASRLHVSRSNSSTV